MGRIDRIKVAKSRTIRPTDSEEWVRSESSKPSTAVVGGGAPSNIPNVDLHELEHDPEWRSWRKDDKGQCSFKAEEGHAGSILRFGPLPQNPAY